MLFEFKSKATGTLIMTDAVGRQALDIIGKAATTAGIITMAEMPIALLALKQAYASSKFNSGKSAASTAASKTSGDREEDGEQDSEPPVSLANRLLPLIEMIERSHAAKEDIIWGV